MFLLGYDIGSSSIKASLVEVDSGKSWVVQSPAAEMEIIAAKPTWAEQHPETWWDNLVIATRQLLAATEVNPADIRGIGISYQMHGLVLVDKNFRVLRPSIIWCDGRAVDIGNQAFDAIGRDKCLAHLLNSPGNFTAARLRWVKENEPGIFEKVYKMMLPGDYIAMRLTGELVTTPGGLSQATLWDFKKNKAADLLLDHFGLPESLLPAIAPTFSLQGVLQTKVATEIGLAAGTPVAYRAGDQPNNALSLNVLEPGEIAATGGTSGVVYGVVNQPIYDPSSRVNGFVHVNHSAEKPSIGILLCINGTGIQHAWMRKNVAGKQVSYAEMEQAAGTVPVGSDGLRVFPFGNGPERMLNNRTIGASVEQLHFNRHTQSHLYRAALEGIAFSFVYGVNILREMGLQVQVMRAGNDNLFQSGIFSTTIANTLGVQIELLETTGATGAAKAAGVATGIYSSLSEAMQGGKTVKVFEPDDSDESLRPYYLAWEADLKKKIEQSK